MQINKEKLKDSRAHDKYIEKKSKNTKLIDSFIMTVNMDSYMITKFFHLIKM